MEAVVKADLYPLREFDKVLVDIVDYVARYEVTSELALENAWIALLDSLGCAIQALDYSACRKLLGPLVPGSEVENGARVPGTNFELDPVQAAFNIGTMIRWLDFNDTWLAAEWGHPSDNLGAILATADWVSRNHEQGSGVELTMRDLMVAMVKAHEIQGCLALENSFNRVGLDHVLLVKVASIAVISPLLGLNRQQSLNALSLAWVDGQALRTYRHSPNTGSRKSWAAGDATSRAVRLALLAKKGEMGYPTALTAEKWGFYDVSFQGEEFTFQRPYGSYVMENILFKISYPAEFHAQSAIEAAVTLHQKMKEAGKSIAEITRVRIRTQEAAIRIIDKKGILRNPADRDHCLQYMVAVALIFGNLRAQDYEDGFAANPAIDELRSKIECWEDPQLSSDYLDSAKRSIANGVSLEFADGSSFPEVLVEYPIGHARRRSEGAPLLMEKYAKNLALGFTPEEQREILALTLDRGKLENSSVADFMDLFQLKSLRIENSE